MTLFFPLFLAALSLLSAAQQQTPSLESVLKKMDAAAANFQSAQANVSRQQYERVIQELDIPQSGVVYYRREGKAGGKDNGKSIEMKLDLTKPDAKSVLFSGGDIKVYEPKIDQLTIYHAGKNRAEFESYLVLGFGGSGQDLVKSFDVSLQGTETIDNVASAKLQLIPKSDKVRATFKQILLWIDLDRGISVQQQFDQPDGNYLLVKYSAIQLNNPKIPNEVFRIKTTSKTQTVSPQG
jgi:outer membrane lipoprotein-sorting protein